MTPPLLYIHGLGSDRNSTKFLALQTFFPDMFDFHCMEWTEHSNIDRLISQTHTSFENNNQLIVFGDSTGANFAYQLRDKRALNGLQTKLILSAPLLDLSKRITDFNFPKRLIPQLIKIEHPTHALLICPMQDELINHTALKSDVTNKLQVLQVNDTHRLPRFKEYLPAINAYIEAGE
jgi:predicted esterase YcpF (UPF0227 family)